MLAEVRPYSFIIPSPYLAVNNDNKTETDEWKLADEKKNDTDDDDDVHARKRIVLFIYLLIFICALALLLIRIYLSLTFLMVIFRTFQW